MEIIEWEIIKRIAVQSPGRMHALGIIHFLRGFSLAG